MGSVPSPKHYEILSPVKQSAATSDFRMIGGEEDWFASEQASHRKRTSRSRLMITMFVLGAVVTLAWQSYGNVARAIIAGFSPQLRWLAPQDVIADTTFDKIEQITHNVDRIASDIAAGHEQITHSIDNLAAGQQHMMLEIIRLRALSQFAPSKKEDPPPQPAPGPAHKASQRSLQAR